MAKILLVEDNELNRDMLSRRLRRRGYEVVIAIDGAEGVSMAMSENPDLILMDMSLPIMNGWEATQTLKSDTYTHSIPIIALTAHAMVGEREKALAAGCDDYDTKPVDLKQLLQKIETLLTHPLISSEPPLEKAMSTVVQGVEQPVISGMVEQADRFESPEKVAPIASQAVEQLAIPGIVEQADRFESPEKVTPIASQVVEPPAIPTIVERADQFEPPEKVTPIASQAVEPPAIPVIVERADQFKISEKSMPLESEMIKPPPPNMQEQISADSMAGQLLLVDDNEANRDMLSRRLERKGYFVIAVDSGEAALEVIGQETIDLVLLDIMMPGIDGVETLRRIRQTYSQSHLPVVMVTAKDQSDDMVRAFDLGANDYITKPINFSVAMARIQAQLTTLQATRQQIVVATHQAATKVNHQSVPDAPQAVPPRPAPAQPTPVPSQPFPEAAQAVPPQPVPPQPVPGPPWPAPEAPPLRPPSNIFLGRQLGGRYQITRILAEEQFNHTLVARDIQHSGEPVQLLKKLNLDINHPQLLKTVRQLLASESRTVKQLNRHDKISMLLKPFLLGQDFYLVQEFMEGSLLADELQRNSPLPPIEVLELTTNILRILECFHQKQLIHTDIQPYNLLRRKWDDQLVLIDFGITKRILIQLGHVSYPHRKLLFDHRGYMPPEQRLGQPVFNSDIYAVGMIALQALTGKQPEEFTINPGTGELNWRDFVDVNKDVAQLFNKMVAQNHRNRYSSVGEAINDVLVEWYELRSQKNT